MAERKSAARLENWKDLEECYMIEHGNFKIYIEVPVPEDTNSRSAAKNVAAKIKSLLEANRNKDD